jgi:hypothetical protein
MIFLDISLKLYDPGDVWREINSSVLLEKANDIRVPV